MKKVWIVGAVIMMIEVTFNAHAQLVTQAVIPPGQKTTYTMSPLESLISKVEKTDLYREWQEVVERSKKIANPHERYLFLSQKAQQLARKAGSLKSELEEHLHASASDVEANPPDTRLKGYLSTLQKALKRNISLCSILLNLKDELPETQKALRGCIGRVRIYDNLYGAAVQIQNQMDAYKLTVADYLDTVRLFMSLYASIFDFQEWFFNEISVTAQALSKIPPEIVSKAAAMLKGKDNGAIMGDALKQLSELFPALEELNSIGNESSENFEDVIREFKEKYYETGGVSR
jgi:hypothetical protein